MNIGVCAKVTPDTDTRIKIAGSGSGIDPAGVKMIISPYDNFAVVQAVVTKEKVGGTIHMISVGDSDSVKALRNGLALGADELILVDDPAALNIDPLGVAKCIAAAAKGAGVELLLCGKQAIDDDNSQVPAMVAEILGWPQVSMVTGFDTDGTTFTATRDIGGGVEEVLTGPLPVVITCDKGLVAARYPKLPAIMKAKKKPMHTKSIGDLGLSADDVAPAVTVSDYGLPPARPGGRKLEGDVPGMVSELVSLLRNEAKVI